MNKAFAHILRFALGLLLIGVVLWALGSSWEELEAQVQFTPSGLIWVFVGTSIAAATTAGRWKWISEQLRGTQLPFMTYFFALVVTRVIGLFTSTLAVDLIGRGIALRQGGSDRPVSHTATVVVVERLYDLLLPATLLLWALFAREESWALGACIGGFLLFAAVGHAWVLRLAGGAYQWLSRRRAGGSDDDDGDLSDAVAPELLTTRAGLVVVLAGLGRYLGMWIYVVGVARTIGLDVSALAMLAATPTAQLSSLLGFTPGGLGIQEIGWAAGLALVGVSAAGSTAFILAQRAAFLATFSLLSAMSYPFRGRREESA